MARYKTSLRKAFDSSINPRRKWSTTFIVEAASATAAAAALVVGWQNFLREACRSHVFAYQVYATSVLANDEDYVIQNIPVQYQRGTLTKPNDEPYKATVCVGVELQTVGGGRPSRKFWRPGLFEGDIAAGTNFVGNIHQLVAVQFADFLDNASGVVVDPDGQAFQTGVPVTYLTDRRFGDESANNVPNAPAN